MAVWQTWYLYLLGCSRPTHWSMNSKRPLKWRPNQSDIIHAWWHLLPDERINTWKIRLWGVWRSSYDGIGGMLMHRNLTSDARLIGKLMNDRGGWRNPYWGFRRVWKYSMGSRFTLATPFDGCVECKTRCALSRTVFPVRRWRLIIIRVLLTSIKRRLSRRIDELPLPTRLCHKLPSYDPLSTSKHIVRTRLL